MTPPNRLIALLLAVLVLLAAAGAPRLAHAKIDPVALEKTLAAVATYQFGQSRKALIELKNTVAQASKDPDEARPLARRLAKVIESPKTTPDAKQFLCRQLWIIGTAEQAPVLAKLLDDEKLSHMARYALERIPDPAVDKVLREAMGGLKGKLLAGVVTTLGERRDAKATEPLIKLLGDHEESVASAAAAALGKIGGARAAEGIAAARPRAKGRLKSALTDAWLRAAEALHEARKKAEAAAIFEKLYAPAEPRHVRVAALRGRLATMDPAQAVKEVVGLIEGKDLQMRVIAVGYLAEMPGNKVTAAVARLLPKADPKLQSLLVGVLAGRGDTTAAPAIAALALSGKSEELRLAALRALAQVGDASSVPLLADIAASQSRALREAARQSLSRLRGKEVDQAIFAALKGAKEPARIELVRSLRARRAEATVGSLMQVAATDTSPAVRGQCFTALADLAAGEHLGKLVGVALKEPHAEARGAAERAMLAVARRVGDPAKRLQPILAAHARATGNARATALRVLGRLGGAGALAAVRKDLSHADQTVHAAAVRMLAAWPDAAAAGDLAALAKTAKDPNDRILALRGYIRVIGLASERPAAETVRMCQQALALATRPDERKLVLSGLANIGHPDALKVAQACAEDPALKAEAALAIRKINDALTGPPVATASHNEKVAGLAIDNDKNTRWKSVINQKPGIWFQVDLKRAKTLTRIVLDSSRQKPQDYPRAYEVYVSNSPKDWGKPVVVGKGTRHVVDIRMPPTTGRYLKIVSTGTARNNWSIYDLRIEAK